MNLLQLRILFTGSRDAGMKDATITEKYETELSPLIVIAHMNYIFSSCT